MRTFFDEYLTRLVGCIDSSVFIDMSKPLDEIAVDVEDILTIGVLLGANDSNILFNRSKWLEELEVPVIQVDEEFLRDFDIMYATIDYSETIEDEILAKYALEFADEEEDVDYYEQVDSYEDELAEEAAAGAEMYNALNTPVTEVASSVAQAMLASSLTGTALVQENAQAEELVSSYIDVLERQLEGVTEENLSPEEYRLLKEEEEAIELEELASHISTEEQVAEMYGDFDYQLYMTEDGEEIPVDILATMEEGVDYVIVEDDIIQLLGVEEEIDDEESHSYSSLEEVDSLDDLDLISDEEETPPERVVPVEEMTLDMLDDLEEEEYAEPSLESDDSSDVDSGSSFFDELEEYDEGEGFVEGASFEGIPDFELDLDNLDEAEHYDMFGSPSDESDASQSPYEDFEIADGGTMHSFEEEQSVESEYSAPASNSFAERRKQYLETLEQERQGNNPKASELGENVQEGYAETTPFADTTPFSSDDSFSFDFPSSTEHLVQNGGHSGLSFGDTSKKPTANDKFASMLLAIGDRAVSLPTKVNKIVREKASMFIVDETEEY